MIKNIPFWMNIKFFAIKKDENTICPWEEDFGKYKGLLLQFSPPCTKKQLDILRKNIANFLKESYNGRSKEEDKR